MNQPVIITRNGENKIQNWHAQSLHKVVERLPIHWQWLVSGPQATFRLARVHRVNFCDLMINHLPESGASRHLHYYTHITGKGPETRQWYVLNDRGTCYAHIAKLNHIPRLKYIRVLPVCPQCFAFSYNYYSDSWKSHCPLV